MREIINYGLRVAQMIWLNEWITRSILEWEKKHHAWNLYGTWRVGLEVRAGMPGRMHGKNTVNLISHVSVDDMYSFGVCMWKWCMQ